MENFQHLDSKNVDVKTMSLVFELINKPSGYISNL